MRRSPTWRRTRSPSRGSRTTTPAEYADLLEASKDEGGELVIYSNTSEENWAPIFRDFKKKFPWVEKVSANDLDSDEVFQKVLSEQSTGNSPADLVVSNAASAWADFADREDTLMDYKSPELGKLPEFAQLLPERVRDVDRPHDDRLQHRADGGGPHGHRAAWPRSPKADPDTFKDKITVRDPESSFGFTVTHAFTEANTEGWDDLERLLPFTRAETSSGTQMEKILAGEYLAGLLHQRWPRVPGRQ